MEWRGVELRDCARLCEIAATIKPMRKELGGVRQLLEYQREEAAEREPWVNISPVMSQGIDPFPRAKNTTKISVVAMRKAPMSSF